MNTTTTRNLGIRVATLFHLALLSSVTFGGFEIPKVAPSPTPSPVIQPQYILDGLTLQPPPNPSSKPPVLTITSPPELGFDYGYRKEKSQEEIIGEMRRAARGLTEDLHSNETNRLLGRPVVRPNYSDQAQTKRISDCISNKVLIMSFKPQQEVSPEQAKRNYEELEKECWKEEMKREEELPRRSDEYFFKETFHSYVGRDPLPHERNGIERTGYKSAVIHDVRYSDPAMRKFFKEQVENKCTQEKPAFVDSLKSESEFERRYGFFRGLGLCRNQVEDNKYSCDMLLKALNTAYGSSRDEATCEEKEHIISRIGGEAKPYSVPNRLCGHFAEDFHNYCIKMKKSCRTIVITGKPWHSMNLIKMRGMGWCALDPQDGTMSSSCLNTPEEFKDLKNMGLLNEARGLGSSKGPGQSVFNIYERPRSGSQNFISYKFLIN